MKKVVLGLTGAVGSGKSTALAIFKKAGAVVSDADAIVRRLLESDRAVYARVVRLLGREAGAGGKLDRAKIAARVFKDKRARAALESILHPLVRREFRRVLSRHKRGLIVLDIPLLFESKMEPLVDKIVVVWAPQKVRLARLARSGRMSAKEARRRSRAQLPLAEKVRRADVVLNNAGPPARLAREIRSLLSDLK